MKRTKKAVQALADAELCAGLGQECRMLIWSYLGAKGPTGVTDLAAGIGWSQPLTSHHLAKMKAMGLVDRTRDGRSVRYSVNAKAAKRLATIFKGGAQ